MNVQLTVTRDDRPLAGAIVRVTGGTYAPQTANASGIVRLRLAAPGQYQLAISAIGYRPDTLTLHLAANRPDTALTVSLDAEAAEVEEIVVQSTRANRRIEEEPLRIEVLSREEIEEKLLMTPGDISMMMNETGGLRVQTTSPSLGGANVRVQGLRGRYTLMLADGLPLYGGQAGGLGLLQVPPMDLGQVEIIKGPSSALYGSSAMGGVINLISRRAPPSGSPGERELLFNATTLGGTDAVLWTSGRVGTETGYSLLGGWHRQGRRDRDGDGWTDVPGYSRVVLRPRAEWSDAAGRNIFVTAGLTAETREGGTLDGFTAPDGFPYAESLETLRFDGGVSSRFTLGEHTLLGVRASAMTQGHEHQFGETAEPDRHTTWFVEATVNRAIGKSVIVFGAAVQADSYRSDSFPVFDYSFSTPGLFAHAEVPAAGWLTLALSARLDRHSKFGTFFNHRLSMLATVSPTWSVRASGGSGYFGPTPFTEETEVTGLSRLAPLAGIDAEKAYNLSLDVQGMLGPLEISATAFGSEVKHAVQQRETDTGSELFNAPDVTRTWGTDVVLRFRTGAYGVTGSYTYTDATEPSPETAVRRTVPTTPRHAAGLVAVREAEGRSRFGLELYYTGVQTLDDQSYRTTSEPYLIVGALAEVRVGIARLFLNLENLGGIRQTEYSPLVRPTRAIDGRWTTDVWAPLDGRVVNGGVRLTL